MTQGSEKIVIAVALAAALWSWSCAGAPPPPSGSAKLSVEVLSSAAGRPPAASPAPARVAVLLDLTSSMKTRTSAGPTRLGAARTAAARLARSLPAETEIALFGYGFSTGMRCAPGARLAGAAAGEPRDYLLERVSKTGAHTEGSLAEAMDSVRGELAAAGALDSSRIVVLTDLSSGCESDPCAAARSLVDAGARLDLVVLGDTEVPACLYGLESDAPPAALEGILPDARPPRFSVESVVASDATAPDFRGVGRADGTSVELPSGDFLIEVRLEPPYRIGPIALSPGTLTQIRVLDFSGPGEPVRAWDHSVRALSAQSSPAAPRKVTW